MTTPNEPDGDKTDRDQNERGKVVPPWKRGEKTVATGLTAGDVAKAAGALGPDASSTGLSRGLAGGERTGADRSDLSGGDEGSSSTPTRAMPTAPAGARPGSAAPGGPAGPGAPQGGPTGAKGPSNAKGPAAGGKPAAGPGPAGQPQAGKNQGGKNQGGKSQGGQAPSAPTPGTKAPGPAAKPGPGGPAASDKPFGGGLVSGSAVGKPAGPKPAAPESPAEAPTKVTSRGGDEKLDLDAIHHVGKAAEKAPEPAGDRAAVRHIPASSIGTPLRAAVQVRRVDPWSIFKVTGVLAVAGFFIWMIAIAVLFGVLNGMGVWDQINSSFGTLVTAEGSSSGGDLITAGQVFGFAALFGVFAGILLTALATILAYIYNVCADVVGGFEITLADLD